jgi:RNA polymerase sigma factor (sigma-70 family)
MKAMASSTLKLTATTTCCMSTPLRSPVVSPQESRATIVLDLFEQYYHRVYCFSRRSLSADAAEDIAQEVFTRLLKLERLPHIQVNVSYLIKIADNLIKRRYNKNQRFNRFLESAEDLAPRTARRPEAPVIEIDRGELERHLAHLTPREADAVRLVICEGLSYQEAAESMGVPVSTVNNWKYRGLQKLKDKYTDPPSEPRQLAAS